MTPGRGSGQPRRPDPASPDGGETIGEGGRSHAERADEDQRKHRQEMLDEALADSFPASDPPSVRPNKATPDPVPESDGQDDGSESGG